MSLSETTYLNNLGCLRVCEMKNFFPCLQTHLNTRKTGGIETVMQTHVNVSGLRNHLRILPDPECLDESM